MINEESFGDAPYENSAPTGRRLKHMRAKGVAAAAAVMACALAFAGCGGTGAQGTSSTPDSKFTPGTLSKDYAGQSITVILPPWGQKKTEEIKKFEDQTGIKVDMQSLAYDSIHDKIVTSEAAHQAPADVIEVDWTWVSQFSKAGWLTDLKPYLGKDTLSDLIGTDIFTSGGKMYGMPYSLDFRGTVYNMTMLKKAGINEVPKSWDDLITAAKAVKKAGIVEYPISVPLSIVEDTSTVWYSLARSSGGKILSENGDAAFAKDKISADALDFFHTMYDEGLIDPGSTKQNAQQVGDSFGGGNSAMVLASSPGSQSTFTDKTKSAVADDEIVFTSTPTKTGKEGVTVGLEEALGIPAQSKNKEAAAMFLTWWMTEDQLTESYEDPNQGLLPPSQKGLQSLVDSGKVSKTVADATKNVQAIIPGGAPTWYTKFSTTVASTIQSVALGKTTADRGISDLAEQMSSISGKE